MKMSSETYDYLYNREVEEFIYDSTIRENLFNMIERLKELEFNDVAEETQNFKNRIEKVIQELDIFNSEIEDLKDIWRNIENYDDCDCSLEQLNESIDKYRYRNNIITDIIFNDDEPTKYDYKYFEAVVDNGKKLKFHYHVGNPLPTKEEMIGLSWNKLCDLVKQKFYEAIER